MGMRDGPVVCKDIKEARCKKGFHMRATRLPSIGFQILVAPYILSKENKKWFIERLHSLKTPTRYVSNLKSKFDVYGTFHGLKSHNYHVILQQLLLLCIRGLLPNRLEKTIVHVSSIFKKIYLKVLDLEILHFMNEEVVVVLCWLEHDFPPSFFNSMTHLPVHLVEELQLCRSIHNY